MCVSVPRQSLGWCQELDILGYFLNTSIIHNHKFAEGEVYWDFTRQAQAPHLNALLNVDGHYLAINFKSTRQTVESTLMGNLLSH